MFTLKKFFVSLGAIAILLSAILVPITPVAALPCLDSITDRTVTPQANGTCPEGSHDLATESAGGIVRTAPGSATDAFSLVAIIQNIIDAVIPFLIGLAILFFVYGVVSYIREAGNEEARATARQFIVWGVISIFVMVSVWGLVHILVGTFNLQGSSEIVGQTYQPFPNSDTLLANKPTDLIQFINRMQAVGSKALIPLFFSIAIFIVLYGVLNYIREGDNEEKRASARQFIIWGVISIFVMLSIWGFVNILVNTFGVDNSTMPAIPNLPRL